MSYISIDFPIAEVVRAAKYHEYIEVVVLCPYCKQHHGHALLEWATKVWYERRGCDAATRALEKQGRTQGGSYYFLAPRQPTS